MGVTRDQVQHAGRRWPEGRSVEVVVQRVVLRVVPHRRDGVAVEVAHHDAVAVSVGVEGEAETAVARADSEREQIH